MRNYAIVDIETTGGYASGSGITEVAICIHNGIEIVDRYETLINPQRHIPLSIQALTGISNEMVADSPPFSEVAGAIFEKLKDCVFVAHNVNFDYSFIKHHLMLAGIDFSAPKLCTVRLARKIKPGLRSYSLGKLCDSLHIPIHNRHRAGGDAAATAILFSELLSGDTENVIAGMLKKTSKEAQLPPHLPKEEMISLPSCPGIYYFKDAVGKEIYVGKALNIKKRVSSHFTGHNVNPQRQHFLRSIYSVTYEKSGTELMALLMEAAEIKNLWPLYNRAMKRPEAKFALYCYEDMEGFKRLMIGKFHKYNDHVHVFNREADGIRMLRKLVSDFGLDVSKCSYGRYPLFTQESLEAAKIRTDAERLPQHAYNKKVEAALQNFTDLLPSFVILDDGRDADERSCIWVERGLLRYMGFIPFQTDLESYDDIKACLQPCAANDYMMQLILSYAQKYPYKVKNLNLMVLNT